MDRTLPYFSRGIGHICMNSKMLCALQMEALAGQSGTGTGAQTTTRVVENRKL